MKEAFLSSAMVMAIILFAPATASSTALGSGYRGDMIIAQSMEQEVASDQETPQEEMESGQDRAQDTESIEGICTGPADCPGQSEATGTDSN